MTEPHPDFTAVQLTLADGVATITLNRPEQGNRITVGAMLALIDSLERAQDSVILVLKANGEDFCFGRDQSERIEGFPRLDSLRLILKANDLLRNFPGVSVALVQGHAIGFGSGLALHCDVTLAADDATLGFDEVLHGLAPLVVVDYLRTFVGNKVATELLMTGRDISAAEALELRMVNRLVPGTALGQEGDALVSHLSAQSPGALRLMKGYALDTAAGRVEDPLDEAVTRLDEWLNAGRPDVPGVPSLAAER